MYSPNDVLISRTTPLTSRRRTYEYSHWRIYRGGRDTCPLSVQFVFILMQFQVIIVANNRLAAPAVGAPICKILDSPPIPQQVSQSSGPVVCCEKER